MTIERPAARADKAGEAMWSNAGGYPHPRRVIPIRKTAEAGQRACGTKFDLLVGAHIESRTNEGEGRLASKHFK